MSLNIDENSCLGGYLVDIVKIRDNLYSAISTQQNDPNKKKIIEKCKSSQDDDYQKQDEENETLKNFFHDNRHFNLEQVIDVIFSNEHMYFIFNEDTRRNQLFDILNVYKEDNQTLVEGSVLDYLSQIIHGLVFLHDNNIFHSNLNTKDIYIYQNGTIKIAGYYYVEKLPKSESVSKMDRKLPYKCSKQEQANITIKYDNWCLGWILYEMCTFEHQPKALDECKEDFSDFQRPKLPNCLEKLSKAFLNLTQINWSERKSLNQLIINDINIKSALIDHKNMIQVSSDYIGKKLENKYKVLEYIGRGGFGIVFKGADEDNQEIVIKRINQQCINLESETNIQHLSHKNIAKCIDFFEIKGFWFIITEFCNYMSLEAYIYRKKMKQEKIPNEQILEWSIQLFDVLSYIHKMEDNPTSKKKIIHRDIKPTNIMLHNDKESGKMIIKLIDFGESRLQEVGSTKLSSLHGTNYYIAPEVLNQKSYDKRADVWSAGCVLYELIELKRLFEVSENNIEKLNQILANDTLFLRVIFQKIFVDNDNRAYSAEIFNLLKVMQQKQHQQPDENSST